VTNIYYLYQNHNTNHMRNGPVYRSLRRS